MINRNIGHSPAQVIANFDWFNDYKDTRSFVVALGHKETLEALDKGYREWYARVRTSATVTYNWLPVVGSLLTKLQRASFTLVAVEDGEDLTKLEGTKREQRQQAKALICGVDESHLFVDNSEGVRRTIFIVLGNEPEETVCDYSVDPELDAVVKDFSNQWEGRPCPTN